MSAASHPPIQTVAIIGAGAMGAMYADHFARAGFRTLLLATGDRAARLREDPITVNGQRLDAEVFDPASAEHTPGAEAPVADLMIVAVKQHQLADAIELMQPLIAPHTTILSVLNGLQSESTLLAGLRNRDGASIAEEQVPLCIALAMAAEREGRHARFTQAGRLLFGPAETDGQPSPRMRALAAAFEQAGLDYGMPDDMRHQMWWKFMVNVSVNQPSAVLRAPYGVFTAPGPARELMDALIAEVRDVAAAEGVVLDQDDVDRWYDVLDAQPADGVTSTHQDVLAGRPTEVDLFAGHVVELGQRHGIPVPVNQTMLQLLRATTAMAQRGSASS